MVDDLNVLSGARSGHFVLESGLHGTVWLNLDNVFSRPAQLVPSAGRIAELLLPYKPQVVCGPLIGGALLGQLVALAGGLRLVYSERTAWSPGALWSARYELAVPFRSLVRGQRVAVVDDVINAGSALRATVAAVQQAGGEVVAAAALLRLGDMVLPYAKEHALPLHVLAVQPDSTWAPDRCPLCRQGVPLDT